MYGCLKQTGNALSFFLHNVASNPDKQDRLYAEIQQFLPDSTTVPTGDTLQKMVYLKACLRESFRLHYPVFGGSGRVMPEDTVFSGYRVPKGVIHCFQQWLDDMLINDQSMWMERDLSGKLSGSGARSGVIERVRSGERTKLAAQTSLKSDDTQISDPIAHIITNLDADLE